MKVKGGIDPEGDEMTPPTHKPKDGHVPGHHSPHSPKIDHHSVEHAPMPAHKPGKHPLEHYKKYEK